MSNSKPLEEGQEVFLKQPLQVYARVIGPLKGDFGLPEEQVRYAVQILPLEQYYLAADLELAQQSHGYASSLTSVSPQSVEQPSDLEDATANLSARDPFSDLTRQIKNLIAVRAYQLWGDRGFAHGHDAEDWLRAESEILLNVPAEIMETETQMTLRAETPGFRTDTLEVRVAPRAVCIAGKLQDSPKRARDGSAVAQGRPNRIFRVFDLPSEIDPDRVDASLDSGLLEVKLQKAGVRKLVQVRAKTASA